MTTRISEPNVTVNITNASLEVQNKGQRLLFVGTKSSGGSATGGLLTENILDDNSWYSLFGEGSPLAAMINAARKENKVVPFDAICLDENGSGVAATGIVAASGTATEDGTIEVFVGSERNNKYEISVSTDDTATIVGDAIAAAITADSYSFVDAVNTTGSVAMTAKVTGTFGNDICLSIDGSVAGLTFSTTAMASGATDPVLTSALDVIGEKRYQGIVWQYGEDVSALTTFLDARFNVDNNVLDGCGFVGTHDSYANHLATLGALNSENLVMFCDKQENTAHYTGGSVSEVACVKASMFAAIRSLRLTDGASVSNYVITANGALDSFGGAALASKPYFNTPFPNLAIIKTGRGFSSQEVTGVENVGGTLIGNNSAETEVITGAVLTTYKTDSAGNVDITFKYLNYRDTSSSVREYYFNNLKKRFAQSRLTEGSISRGRDMANQLVITAYCEKLYQDLAGPEYVLVQDGEEAIDYYKNHLIVVLDLALGKATIQMITPLVTQLRDIRATQKISFSTES